MSGLLNHGTPALSKLFPFDSAPAFAKAMAGKQGKRCLETGYAVISARLPDRRLRFAGAI